MTNNQLSLHQEGSRSSILGVDYQNPLLYAKKEYKISHKLLESMRDPVFDQAWYDGCPPSVQQLQVARIDLLNKGMTFASTLFSAINSPFGLMISFSKRGTLKNLPEPEVDVRKLDRNKLTHNEARYINSPSLFQQLKTAWKGLLHKAICFTSNLFSVIGFLLVGRFSYSKRDKLHDLREVVAEITKHDMIEPTPSQKEVLIACYMMLAKELKGIDANKELYSHRALQLLHALLFDPNVPYSTYLLACGRATLMEGFPERRQDLRKQEVLLFLKDIKENPEKISNLNQDWKTYVQLARMVFAWKYVFFGLSMLPRGNYLWKVGSIL